jgi:hypothetical protein
MMEINLIPAKSPRREKGIYFSVLVTFLLLIKAALYSSRLRYGKTLKRDKYGF